VKISRYFKIF